MLLSPLLFKSILILPLSVNHSHIMSFFRTVAFLHKPQACATILSLPYIRLMHWLFYLRQCMNRLEATLIIRMQEGIPP